MQPYQKFFPPPPPPPPKRLAPPVSFGPSLPWIAPPVLVKKKSIEYSVRREAKRRSFCRLEEVLEQSSSTRQVCYFVFSVHFTVRLLSNRSKKTLKWGKNKYWSSILAYSLGQCHYRISSNNIAGAITSFFAPKEGDYSREAIISNTAHYKSCIKYFVLLSH